MAIAQMTKVMIVCHRDQAPEMLEALQEAGLVEVLDAERAMVTKTWPDLQVEGKRPRDLEDAVARLEKAIAFLRDYTREKTSIFRPRHEVAASRYTEVVRGRDALQTLDEAERTQNEMERLENERESTLGTLEMLRPWTGLDMPVEQLRTLDSAACITGLIPRQHYDEAIEDLNELGAAVQNVGATDGAHACVIVCLKEAVAEVQRVLRAADFETVNFEGMTGTVSRIIEQKQAQLDRTNAQLSELQGQAGKLARSLLPLQILYDHYTNLLDREQTRTSVPATETTMLLEGWVRKHDFPRVQKVVARFDACSVDEISPAEGEEPPVEIENNKAIEPFEVITRLYGMPRPDELDPTLFLAPFFALFFGLCLTDAGYGLILVAILAFFAVKMRGGKRMLWLLMISSVLTVIAGAATGGWFGDAIQQFLPGLNSFRDAVMWFDPLEDPMKFFALSLALGYFQIIFGIAIAFVHKLLRRDYMSAVFDHLVWLIMLNSIVIYGFSKAGVLPGGIAPVFGIAAMVAGLSVLFFGHREGGLGARFGMGFYQLFSTIFFVGDVLSYLRLMALGMATAGLGMAVNVIAQISVEIPYVGWVIAPLVFVGGHLFNLAINALGAFVHTLRLQYVEFFPKFLTGGGREFKPLRAENRYTLVTPEKR